LTPGRLTITTGLGCAKVIMTVSWSGGKAGNGEGAPTETVTKGEEGFIFVRQW
jgi:hypothetical protein